MKIDAEVMADSLDGIGTTARSAEQYGFDCLWFNETKHDPFVQLALASSGTKSISLGTSIALAFTRSPTTLAYSAWDVQGLSQGRLILGLGSQVRGHIERRFGLRWESPLPKMREVILAMKAVWANWQEGKALDFQGRFFKINLMSPFFSPGRIEHPRIPIYIAGVNRGMFRLAGEVGDGLHLHPLHTLRYLEQVMVPALEGGLAKSRRKRNEVEVTASVFAAVGDTRGEVEAYKQAYREQIAFYASTKAYRKVAELHGWEGVCDRLHDLSVRGEWERLAGEVPDEMLQEVVVEGTWDGIGAELKRRYGGLVDRVRLYRSFDGSQVWGRLVDGFRA